MQIRATVRSLTPARVQLSARQRVGVGEDVGKGALYTAGVQPPQGAVWGHLRKLREKP